MHDACLAIRGRIATLAGTDRRSPLRGLGNTEIEAGGGRLYAKGDPSRGESYADIVMRHGAPDGMEATVDSKAGDEAKKFGMNAFGAQFCEVQVDPDIGAVRVTRLVGAFAGGRVLNPKTARSQLLGGIVMGIGMALHEESVVDERYGHFVTRSLADYHVPVNADVPDIDVLFIDERDAIVNPIGVKGLGEIGIVGVAAAVGNAVFHATGRRIRDLPITPDKLLCFTMPGSARKRQEREDMTLKRMDNVLIVVDDLEATKAFFIELGLTLEGETTVEGRSIGSLLGLEDVRSTLVTLRTPDGQGIELDKFHTPDAIRFGPVDAPMNTLGIRRIMFAVDDIAAVVARMRAHGAQLIGEMQYEDTYRLAYIRGPEGIIVALAEQLG